VFFARVAATDAALPIAIDMFVDKACGLARMSSGHSMLLPGLDHRREADAPQVAADSNRTGRSCGDFTRRFREQRGAARVTACLWTSLLGFSRQPNRPLSGRRLLDGIFDAEFLQNPPAFLQIMGLADRFGRPLFT